MKKFSEQEWNEFQERVKQASLGEETLGVNLFRADFKVWIRPDSSVALQHISSFEPHYPRPTRRYHEVYKKVETDKESKQRTNDAYYCLMGILIIILIFIYFSMR